MSGKKPVLCLVVTRMIKGGAQQVVLDLIEHLPADRFDLHVVAGRQTGSEGSYWDRLRALLPEDRIHESRHLVRNVNPFRDISAYFELKRLFKRIRPDIVHAHTSKAGAVARLAAIKMRVPRIIYSTHGTIYEADAKIPGVSGRKLLLKIFKAIDGWLGPRTDMTVALSEKEVGTQLSLGLCPGSKITCIHNGIHLQKFAEIQREKEFHPERVRLGIAGRLNHEKGHDVLLRALGKMTKRFPGLTLEIAGDGPLDSHLRQRVRELGIADRVHFHGFLEDMVEFLRNIDLFVLSSYYEGFGLVLVEAMAAALPVVATDVGGVREVVKDGETGLVVPSGSESELAIGIEYFLNNPHLARRFGDKGRHRAMALFSLKHMIEAHAEIYQVAEDNRHAPVENYMEADLHMHSSFSFDSDTDLREMLIRLRERGVRLAAITDHDNVEGALQAVRLAPEGLMVIPGVEVTTDVGDIIGLFVTGEVPDGDHREAIAEIRRQGGIVYLPHPFRGRQSISLELMREVDVVEVVNGRSQGMPEEEIADNELVELAKTYGKTGVGGSDAHRLKEVAEVRTCLPKFDSLDEVRELLLSGKIFPVRRRGAWVEATLQEDQKSH